MRGRNTSLILLFAGCMTLFGLLLYNSQANAPKPITQKDYDMTLREMQTMVELTRAGDVDGGEKAFDRAHDFYHDVDPALRQADPRLAEALWQAVGHIEGEYAGERKQPRLVSLGEEIIKLTREAENSLDLRP